VEVIQGAASKTTADDVSGDEDQAMVKTCSETSCTVSSVGEFEPATTLEETDSEAEEVTPLPGPLEQLAALSSENEAAIDDVSSLGSPVAPPAAVAATSEVAAASEQEPDLYSLIAQLVELKASSMPEQAQQQPLAPPGVFSTPQIPGPMPVQGRALETSVPRETLAAKQLSKSSSGKKTATKSKDAKPKHSHEAAAAAQFEAQSAKLRSMQVQARVAQAAQAAYAAQWQAAWQMQAAQAMQWQRAYAGRMAQWQSAQKQAVQAAWAMQTAQR